MVAAGTLLLSQAVKMPMSLLTTPFVSFVGAKGNINITPAQNEIRPAWVLYGNPYLLARAQAKYDSRSRAIIHSTDFPLFRPLTIALMRNAISVLIDCGGGWDTDREGEGGREGDGLQTERLFGVGTDTLVTGLGKGVMRDADRIAGISAYRSTTVRWALEKLLCPQWRNVKVDAGAGVSSVAVATGASRKNTKEFWEAFARYMAAYAFLSFHVQPFFLSAEHGLCLPSSPTHIDTNTLPLSPLLTPLQRGCRTRCRPRQARGGMRGHACHCARTRAEIFFYQRGRPT
jgi:hypothetical protein